MSQEQHPGQSINPRSIAAVMHGEAIQCCKLFIERGDRERLAAMKRVRDELWDICWGVQKEQT